MKTNLLLRPCRILAMILVAASFALPARAALLVYEGFQYIAGTDLIPPSGGSGQGTGLGWDGPWFNALVVGGFPIDASSLYPPTAAIAPVGGSIRQPLLHPADGFWAKRLIAPPLTIGPGADLWLSAEMATGAEAGTGTAVHFHFTPYGATEGTQAIFGTGTSGGTEHWLLYAGSPVYGPEIDPGVPALLVAKVHRDELTDTFTFKFWVNPRPTTSPSGEPTEAPVETLPASGFSTLSYVTLVAAGNGVHQFDEIRIGTTYADINGVPSDVTITTSASPTAGGTTSGGGTFSIGHSVPLVATANAGYTFVNWTEGGTEVSTSASFTFLASANRTLVANFASCPTITVNPATLPNSAPGATYNQTVTASGGSEPYTYAVPPGTLPPGLTLSTSGTLSGTPTTAGSFTFTITATDAGSCPGSSSYTVQIVKLVILCPEPATVECPAPAAATDLASFIAQGGSVNGGCAPITVTHVGDATAGTCPTTITRTYRATDACGRTADGTQTITVQDTIPPIISPAPSPVNVQCPSEIPVAGTLPASDNCSGTLTAIATDGAPVGSFPCKYSFTRTWNVSDACGNPAIPVTQLINVQDTTRPVLVCPENQTIVTSGGGAPVFFTATATDNCDPPPTITFTPHTGSTFPIGTTPVTCRATDRCGNWSECTFTVTVTALGCIAASQEAYVKASNTGAEDRFGYSMAIDGDTMVIGAPHANGSGSPFGGSGAAYVFVRSGSTWIQQAYLKASNADPNDYFGWSVAISGNTIVVGARGEQSNATGVNGNQDDNSADWAGATYVFVRSGTIWSQQAYLKASNNEAGDLFGYSVAVSGDTVVVGAPGEDSNAIGFNGPDNNLTVASGAAYVFVRSGVTWVQHAYLKASNPGVGDCFGQSVTVSGGTVVVGAAGESSNATKVNGPDNDLATHSGAAYVFTRNGATWSQQAYLKASNTESSDWFGLSVAISGDTVVVGAPNEDSNVRGVTRGSPHEPNNSASGAGAAYVFARIGSTWSQQAYVKASNTEAEDSFGSSVAISGNTLVVGSSFHTKVIETGISFIYSGEDSRAVGVNGNQLDNNALNAGAAYVFVRNDDAWVQQAYLKASNTEAEDFFGTSVAISSETVAVGAIGEASNATGLNGNQADNSASWAGAAYAFVLVDEPCALDDIFDIPTDAPLTIPIGALLGNDAHSRALRISFSDADPTTAQGVTITSVGSPVTALRFPGLTNPPAPDTFTYRISDGTHEATGTVHLRPVTSPSPPLNTLAFSPSSPLASGFTLVFGAPAAGTYALERQTLGVPGQLSGLWSEVVRIDPAFPGAKAFTDALLSGGALYRVRKVP